MSVSSTISSVSYSGNASTTAAYPVSFQFFDATDLTVYVVDSAGVSTTLVLGTGYTVSGGAGSTGNVLTTSAIPSTSQVVITRNTAKTQLTSYTTGDRFPASTHEKALDKLTFIAQENARKSVPDTASTTGSAPYVLGLSASGGSPSWVPQSSSGIADGSITTSKLSDSSVTTAKVADSAVTTAKIADNSITSAKIANGAIVTADLADASVTPAKLSTGGPTWDTSGNLGIGTSSPIRKLHVAGAISGETILEQTDALANYRKYNAAVNGGSGSVGASYFFRILNDAGTASTKDIYNITPDGTINALGNPITNCKTTAKAWVNFNGTGTLSGTYVQSGGSATVTFSQAHGLPVGAYVYFAPTSGGAPAGATTVSSIPSPTQIVVGTAAGSYSGNVTITSAFIRSSYNISSITKSAVGVYTVNFSSNLADANYSAIVTATNAATNVNTANNVLSQTSSSFALNHVESSANADSSYIFAAVFGN